MSCSGNCVYEVQLIDPGAGLKRWVLISSSCTVDCYECQELTYPDPMLEPIGRQISIPCFGPFESESSYPSYNKPPCNYCYGDCRWEWRYYPEPNPFHEGYWIGTHSCINGGTEPGYTCECTEVGRDGYYEGETVFTLCYHP